MFQEHYTLNVKRTEQNGLTTYFLSGGITQSVDFGQLLGPIPDAFQLDCSDVSSINSVGVREWISFFEKLRADRKRLRFLNCSPALVYPMNMFSNFIPIKELESILIPFFCEKCSAELTVSYKIKDLTPPPAAFPEIECTKCGGKAVFDEVVEDYLSFLLVEKA